MKFICPKSFICKSLLLAISAGFSTASFADAAAVLPTSGWNAAFRYRFESVDDDALARTANANTARLRLGWRSAFGNGFNIVLEGEGVAELNRSFDSTANRQTSYPIVADARALEINQAALGWQNTNAQLSVGRQRLIFGNQRFIGNVGWRQNEQTFDAFNVNHKLSDALNFRFAYLNRVHRVNGDSAINSLASERDLSSHLLNVSTGRFGGEITAYGYFFEDQDAASGSTQSTGLRWTGAHKQAERVWGWSAEIAQQKDYRNNPQNFSHHYLLLEPSLSYGDTTWRIGYERLGGNGQHAFQTPLATLHAFNGWADKFLVTPAMGLEDRYLSAGFKWGRGHWQDRLNWALSYHDYRADKTSADLGQELNASLAVTLGQGWSAMLKLADYRADSFARDTRKVWLQVEWVR